MQVMEGDDAWVRPFIDGLRRLFQRGSVARNTQVAVAVAVAHLEPDAEHEPGKVPDSAQEPVVRVAERQTRNVHDNDDSAGNDVRASSCVHSRQTSMDGSSPASDIFDFDVHQHWDYVEAPPGTPPQLSLIHI